MYSLLNNNSIDYNNLNEHIETNDAINVVGSKRKINNFTEEDIILDIFGDEEEEEEIKEGEEEKDIYGGEEEEEEIKEGGEEEEEEIDNVLKIKFILSSIETNSPVSSLLRSLQFLLRSFNNWKESNNFEGKQLVYNFIETSIDDFCIKTMCKLNCTRLKSSKNDNCHRCFCIGAINISVNMFKEFINDVKLLYIKLNIQKLSPLLILMENNNNLEIRKMVNSIEYVKRQIAYGNLHPAQIKKKKNNIKYQHSKIQLQQTRQIYSLLEPIKTKEGKLKLLDELLSNTKLKVNYQNEALFHLSNFLNKYMKSW